MKIKWNKIQMICLLLIAVCIGLSPANFSSETDSRWNSVIDLSKWDFQTQGIYYLNDYWEFYPNRYIYHSDFNSQNNIGLKRLIEMPRAFYDQKAFEEKYHSNYGTLRATIKIPQKYIGQPMAIRSTLFYMDSIVYVNGVEIIRNSQVGKVSSGSQRLEPSLMASFTPNTPEVQILVHFSQDKKQGNSFGTIGFGLSDQVQNKVIRNLLVDVFVFCIILILAIFNIGFFLKVNRKGVKDSLSLYFGILVVVMGIRVLNSGEHYLLYLLPNIPGELFNKLVFWAYYLVLPSFVLFIFELRKDLLSFKMQKISRFAIGFFGLAVLMLDHDFYGKLMLLNYIYYAAVLAYVIENVFKALKKKEHSLLSESVSITLIMIMIILDSLYLNGYNQFRGYYLGCVVFFVSYVTFRVSRSYSNSVDKLEMLMVEHEELKETTGAMELAFAKNLVEKQSVFEELIYQKNLHLTALEKIAKEFSGAMVILDLNLQIKAVYGQGTQNHFGEEYEGVKFTKYFFGENSENGQLYADILSRVSYISDEDRIQTYLSLLPKVAYKKGRWYGLNTSLVAIEGNEVPYFVIVISDVNKYMKVKQELSQVKKEIKLLRSYAKYEAEIKYLVYRVSQFTEEELNDLIVSSKSVDELLEKLLIAMERFCIWYEVLGFEKTYKKFRQFINELYRLQKEITPIDLNELIKIIQMNNMGEFDGEDRKLIREYIGVEIKVTTEELRQLESRHQNLNDILEIFRPYCDVLADRYGKHLDEIQIEGPPIQVSLRKVGPIIRTVSKLFESIIVHNIEYYDERIKAHKPLAGHISINVQRTPSHVIIEVSDDGAGININTLKDSLYKLNLLSFKEIVSATEEEVLPYIFEPGVYYRETENEYFGIGEGLWRVKTDLARIKGTISVASSYQKSCCFTVEIPVEEVV